MYQHFLVGPDYCFQMKKKNFVDLNEKRRWEKKGGGLRLLAVCTQEGGGVIQMHTLCNRGGGGV